MGTPYCLRTRVKFLTYLGKPEQNRTVSHLFQVSIRNALKTALVSTSLPQSRKAVRSDIVDISDLAHGETRKTQKASKLHTLTIIQQSEGSIQNAKATRN